MKRYLGVVAAAAMLAGTLAVATDALAAGHRRGLGSGNSTHRWHQSRNDALWAGVRFPCPRSAERDQDAGLYVRPGRRDSRRVLRPADERVLKRVPGRQVTAAASVVGHPGSVQPAVRRRRHGDGRAIGAIANHSQQHQHSGRAEAIHY
jgi:hypothetical protein